MNFKIDITRMIDREIEENKKYHEIVKERMLKKEKQIGRVLNCEELKEIYNQVREELGWNKIC